MPTLWLVSDTHFGHEKMVTTFKRVDGSPVRAFDSIDAHDEYLVEQWNSRVKPKDNVWHLGDVTLREDKLALLAKLHGRKTLLLGNHDYAHVRDYVQYFEAVHAVIKRDQLFISHIPVHPGEFDYRIVGNLHGHLHEKRLPDPRYVNCCVEHWDYGPVPYEVARAAVRAPS